MGSTASQKLESSSSFQKLEEGCILLPCAAPGSTSEGIKREWRCIPYESELAIRRITLGDTQYPVIIDFTYVDGAFPGIQCVLLFEEFDFLLKNNRCSVLIGADFAIFPKGDYIGDQIKHLQLFQQYIESIDGISEDISAIGLVCQSLIKKLEKL